MNEQYSCDHKIIMADTAEEDETRQRLQMGIREESRILPSGNSPCNFDKVVVDE